MPLSEKQKREGRKTIAAEIVQLKHRLGELGLFKTMHAMEPVTQEIGWELAAEQGGDPETEAEFRKAVAR